jgi:hypothetical protein
VRLALAPLHRLAEEHGCAVVIVSHLNKGQSENSLYRVGGSIGFPAAVRSALILSRDPRDPDGDRGDRRMLTHIKCNVAPLGRTLAFRVQPVTLPARIGAPKIDTARLSYLGEYTREGGELAQRTPSRREEAETFLRRVLADGPCAATEIRALAHGAGIYDATLQRAKRTLTVKSIREAGAGHWVWKLPTPNAADQLEPLEHLAKEGKESKVIKRVEIAASGEGGV